LGKLTGLTVAASDGALGQVKDVYFDGHHWAARYIVVETGSWLNSREILISALSIQRTDWTRNLLQVGLSQQQVAGSPAIDTAAPGDPHLHSAQAMRRYRLETVDDSMGQIEDFLFDAESWAIRYLVIDTRNWLPDKHLVIPPTWITDVDWVQKVVNLDVSRVSVQAAPEYQAAGDFSRAHETRLYRHYQRLGYWP
jgi:uncharacterized protein YrrD